MKQVIIDGVVYVEQSKAIDKDGMPYVICRSYAAGVCAGYLKNKSEDSKQCTLVESRRLWYWKGAASLHQLANEGVKYPGECKFPAELENDHLMTDVCEVLTVTERAKINIKSVPAWKV